MLRQSSLFDPRTYRGVRPQTYQISPPTAAQTVLQTLPAYRVYLEGGNYSKYTPADFCSDVHRFGAFVKGKALRNIQTIDIQRWVGALKKSMAAKTVSRKLSALTNYFAWLEGQQVLAVNPIRTIRYVRVTSPLPDILFDSECQHLLAVASTNPRTYLLILLLLETGLKKAEIFMLRLTHVDLSNKYAPEVWVKHTGKHVWKDRKLKLPPEVVPVLAAYAEQYAITDSLFPYTPRFLELLLAGAAKQAGLRKKVTAGILRDTFVVRSLRRGAKLEEVLQKIGLNESTWEDARIKYTKLASGSL